eukprot:56196-Hanusia_phi.AAC.1
MQSQDIPLLLGQGCASFDIPGEGLQPTASNGITISFRDGAGSTRLQSELGAESRSTQGACRATGKAAQGQAFGSTCELRTT